MEHQDWSSVSFQTKSTKKSGNKGAPPKITRDDVEDFKLKTIDKALVKRITETRVMRKLNRKQLAIKCSLKEQDIADIENGKILASDSKINKVLRGLYL
jgi:ribosome-binding protein aMBF1 (putative translation factor)